MADTHPYSQRMTPGDDLEYYAPDVGPARVHDGLFQVKGGGITIALDTDREAAVDVDENVTWSFEKLPLDRLVVRQTTPGGSARLTFVGVLEKGA